MTKVYNRDKSQVGETTGTTRVCQMDGCGGRRIAVRWPDNKITYPCENHHLTPPGA